MLEKNILRYTNSKFQKIQLFHCSCTKDKQYTKRFNSSTALVQNTNNKPNELSRCILSPEQYFNSKNILSSIKDRIPDEYLTRKAVLESLYVTDPKVARKISLTILPYLSNNTDRVVAECFPGLGLITRQLLKNGIGPIKLFEPSHSFRHQLKKLAAQHSKTVQLYSKNLVKLSTYCYADKLDDGDRVKKLLKNIPRKGWTDSPSISLIGPMVNNKFMKHVLAALSSQTSLFQYGRVEMFFIMKPHQYLVLSTEQNLYQSKYDYMTVLFNLFFEYKLLNKLPRVSFLPWERPEVNKTSSKLHKIDTDKLYLVYVVSKKDLPLPFEQLVPFYMFMRRVFSRKARVVPLVEYCVPDCGPHIVIPQLKHAEYFKHLDIFTVFGELTPNQVLGVFKEMYNHPNYLSSPFAATVDAEMIRTDMLEPSRTLGLEDSFIDLHQEEELELEEHFSEEDLSNC